jgi:hypothetical protein
LQSSCHTLNFTLTLHHTYNSLGGPEENVRSNYGYPNPTSLSYPKSEICHIATAFSSFNSLSLLGEGQVIQPASLSDTGSDVCIATIFL